MGIADYRDLPETLRRVWSVVRSMWPYALMVAAGAILSEPRALHLTRGVADSFWSMFPWQVWLAIVGLFFLIGFTWVDFLIGRGVAERGPSVERAKEFFQVVGSLNDTQLVTLDLLVRGTSLDPHAPNNMHIGGNEEALTSLHKKATNIFPTNGKNEIWITAAYRPFALKWHEGRSAGSKGGSGTAASAPQPLTRDPRQLSASQSAQIVQGLKGSMGSLIIYNYLAAHDAEQLAEGLAAAFRKAGWQVQRAPLLQIKIPPPTGLAIELPGPIGYQPDPRMDDAHVSALVGGAIEAAGLACDIRARSELWNAANACIIVGHRPQ